MRLRVGHSWAIGIDTRCHVRPYLGYGIGMVLCVAMLKL
ncbi:hypothetical protein F383_29158 [Gossypium arboreum]|uniref:Uncharacterized protein n=1 Tax=Gossypium arboreum TaxID=29729 RepID=A0A0B0PH55_GOSAR|nr:hypothetical protein F383_29158 [Gossypium arboreum]